MENTSNENTESKSVSESTEIPTTISTPITSTTLKPIKIETLNKTSLKSSQEKSLRKLVLDSIPAVAEIMDKIWPKKGTLLLAKQKPYTTIYYIEGEPCFVEVKEESIVPHLKLLHKCKF
jgi:hypothetical protein